MWEVKGERKGEEEEEAGKRKRKRMMHGCEECCWSSGWPALLLSSKRPRNAYCCTCLWNFSYLFCRPRVKKRTYDKQSVCVCLSEPNTLHTVKWNYQIGDVGQINVWGFFSWIWTISPQHFSELWLGCGRGRVRRVICKSSIASLGLISLPWVTPECGNVLYGTIISIRPG